MAPLVAPGCVRYTINGSLEGTTWANIWDVRMLASSGQRTVSIEEYARHLFDSFASFVMTELCNVVILNSISWVDLTDLEGITGEVVEGDVVGPNPTGGRTDNSLAANTAILIRKAGTGNRGTRPGRMYLVGGSETQASATSLVEGYRTPLQSDMTDFLANVTDPEQVPGASVLPTVVHVRNDGTPTNPNYVYNGDSLVTSLLVESRLATQRRRLRR